MFAMYMILLAITSTAHAVNKNRPSLLNTKIIHPFQGRGQQSTIDGRIFISTPFSPSRSWEARVFRKESITYESNGLPNFDDAFSVGKVFRNNSTIPKGNGFGLCFEDISQPYTMLDNGMAQYRMSMIDSPPMRGRILGQRNIELMVSQPFTKQSEIYSFTVGEATELETIEGKYLPGYEPTLTSDGRLMVMKGQEVSSLFYSYNPNPCSITGWTKPRPLNWMHLDPNPELRRYPLSWNPLRSADGMIHDPWRTTADFSKPRTESILFGGAYPWLDHEGRNLLYISGGSDGDKVTIIGAETKWTAYNVDGAVNGDNNPSKFYSGPMWKFEYDRVPLMNFPTGQSNKEQYLPVSKGHDVMPLFGSHYSDYVEVDLSKLSDVFHLMSLPMNELLYYDANKYESGVSDLSRTPDLSGNFYTGVLLGNCSISQSPDPSQVEGNSLIEPHGKGKSIQFEGDGVVKAHLSGDTIPGVGMHVNSLTVQVSVRPDEPSDEHNKMDRFIVRKDDKLGLMFDEMTNQLHFSLEIDYSLVSLGPSPSLDIGKWTHVAYTWDGISGKFNEYINGLPTVRKETLPVIPGTIILGEGNLYVGAGGEDLDGTGFKGAIDEFAIFTHARSARSICADSYGSNCERDAITDPLARTFTMTAEASTCNSQDKLNTVACQSAIHRGCAELGVSNALGSRVNIQGTISQIISSRPPIALAGVPVSSTTTDLTVGCIPINHHSVAVEFEWLAQIDDKCVNEDTIMSANCISAISSFCNTLGWSTGTMFEVTSRPWISCFESSFEQKVDISLLGKGSRSGDLSLPESRLEVSQWCTSKGYGAGLIQSRVLDNMVSVHCFDPSVVVTWSYNPDGLQSTTLPKDNLGTQITWLKELTISTDFPLLECEGDCDNDADCNFGLVCLHRDENEGDVSGCSGRDDTRSDYCIKSSGSWEKLIDKELI